MTDRIQKVPNALIDPNLQLFFNTGFILIILSYYAIKTEFLASYFQQNIHVFRKYWFNESNVKVNEIIEEKSNEKVMEEKIESKVVNQAEELKKDVEKNEVKINVVESTKDVKNVMVMTPENVLEHLHPIVAYPFHMADMVFDKSVDVTVKSIQFVTFPLTFTYQSCRRLVSI
ncbi:hypothetical protein BC833DRAFT_593253, partial [Globomyces pollinis-pini]